MGEDKRTKPEEIQLLEGLEAVRVRPGMYVGSVYDGSGLHNLVWEVVGNSIDQHLAGRARRLRIDVDGEWIEIEDDGPGIPATRHPRNGKSLLELYFSVLCGSGTRDGHFPHVHVRSDVRGAGLSVVTALSERLEIESRHDGRLFRLAFQRGVLVEPVTDCGPTSGSGLVVRFRPDPTILRSQVDRTVVERRMRELQSLLPLLAIELCGTALPWRAGLAGMVRERTNGARLLGETILGGRRTIDSVDVDFALAWVDRPGEDVTAFVNLVPARAGTHLRGLHAAWGDVAQALGSTASRAVASEVLRSGLIAVIHVCFLDAAWGTPTRDKLTSGEVVEPVRRAVAEALTQLHWRAPMLDAFLRERLQAPRPR